MAQQIILILVLALCAYTQADVQLTGQPFECSVNTPPAGKTELIDFSQLLVDIGGLGFAGSIEILAPISNVQVDVYYEQVNNGDVEATFREDVGDLCTITSTLLDDSPASNFIQRIFTLSFPSIPLVLIGCTPPIQAKIYDMDDVPINQNNLGFFEEGTTVNLEIEFETDDEYSCIALTGDVV